LFKREGVLSEKVLYKRTLVILLSLFRVGKTRRYLAIDHTLDSHILGLYINFKTYDFFSKRGYIHMFKKYRIPKIIIIFFCFGLINSKSLIASDAPEVHGVCVYNCDEGPSSSTSYTYPPSVSPEEAQQQRELSMHDANEKGIEYYSSGDWENAVRAFEEALEYSPGDPTIQQNLEKATAKVRESRAVRELDVIEQHSNNARINLNDKENASTLTGKGFDTKTSEPSVVDARISGKEPVIPKEKRTQELINLEAQRDTAKTERMLLEKKLAELESIPVKDYASIAEIRDNITRIRDREHYFNFIIKERLK
jgi:tetratricopeptide (TPR) repeat protein